MDRDERTLVGLLTAGFAFFGGVIGWSLNEAAWLVRDSRHYLDYGDQIAGAICGLFLGGLIVPLAITPGLLAAHRKHPQAEAIRLCGYIGVLIWPAWIVGVVWACTNNQPREREAADDPGAFRVHGVDKATGRDTSLVVEAASAANARVKAELRGVIVTRVSRVPDAPLKVAG